MTVKLNPVSIIYKLDPDLGGPKTMHDLWKWTFDRFEACDGWEFIQTSDDEISHQRDNKRKQHAEDHNSV
jgi:hypothetical protein